MRKEDIVAIVYLCFLMTLHGKVALDRLITSKINRDIVDNIFAGVQLQCFYFLDKALPKTDFRSARIEQRRASCAELRQKHKFAFGDPNTNAA